MGIKRYTAYKDNTITNAFKSNLVTRGTGSNMGLADSVEVFSIFAQANSSSNEQTKTLVQFPVSTRDTDDYPNSGLTTIQSDRTAEKIPASGSVNFFLRLFNVVHDKTLPREFTLIVQPISGAAAVGQWEEGYGLDMENYSYETYNGTGSNWINRKAETTWTAEGGDFITSSAYTYQQFFNTGIEDLEVDITGLVEAWISDTSNIPNGGVGIMLTSSQADGNRSYYTKMFSARTSEYFFKRPVIEARWDSSRKDQRGSFYVSSSILSSADNLNTIYFYNYVRQQLADLPNVGTGPIHVDVYTSASAGTKLTTTPSMPVTGGWVDTGIYSASFALNTTESVVFDRWFSGSIYYHTGSFKPITFNSSNIFETQDYITSISNLRSEYSRDDGARLRVYTRRKNWNPTIYTVAQSGIPNYIIDNVYYKVVRTIDNYEVIPYGTGSLDHTRLSYDVSGSYFDLNVKLLEKGFEYGILFSFYINGQYDEHNHAYKFKVVE